MEINDLGDERKIETGIAKASAQRIQREMNELGENVRIEFVPNVVAYNPHEVKCVDCGDEWTSNKGPDGEVRCLECGSKKFCKV